MSPSAWATWDTSTRRSSSTGPARSRQNYWRVLASKQVLTGLTVSTDYAVIDDDGMLHQGATWLVDQPWVDTARGEYGVRLRGGSHQTAFAFSGRQQMAAVTIQVGYANVYSVFGVLNGDSYGAGDRVFIDGIIHAAAGSHRDVVRAE